MLSLWLITVLPCSWLGRLFWCATLTPPNREAVLISVFISGEFFRRRRGLCVVGREGSSHQQVTGDILSLLLLQSWHFFHLGWCTKSHQALQSQLNKVSSAKLFAGREGKWGRGGEEGNRDRDREIKGGRRQEGNEVIV